MNRIALPKINLPIENVNSTPKISIGELVTRGEKTYPKSNDFFTFKGHDSKYDNIVNQFFNSKKTFNFLLSVNFTYISYIEITLKGKNTKLASIYGDKTVYKYNGCTYEKKHTSIPNFEDVFNSDGLVASISNVVIPFFIDNFKKASNMPESHFEIKEHLLIKGIYPINESVILCEYMFHTAGGSTTINNFFDFVKNIPKSEGKTGYTPAIYKMDIKMSKGDKTNYPVVSFGTVVNIEKREEGLNLLNGGDMSIRSFN